MVGLFFLASSNKSSSKDTKCAGEKCFLQRQEWIQLLHPGFSTDSASSGRSVGFLALPLLLHMTADSVLPKSSTSGLRAVTVTEVAGVAVWLAMLLYSRVPQQMDLAARGVVKREELGSVFTHTDKGLLTL